MSDTSARIRQLEEENEILQAEVAWLKGEDYSLPQSLSMRELGMTQAEWRCISVISRRESVSHEAAYAAIYGDSNVGTQIINVWVCKARPKLATIGVEINTLWGFGYSMPAASQEKFRAFIAAHEAQVAA